MRFLDFIRKRKAATNDGAHTESKTQSDAIAEGPSTQRPLETNPTTDEHTVYSQYSDMPRFYQIDGVKYDIDDPNDIVRLPLFKTIITIRGEKYGMDSILLEHSRQAYGKNMVVYQAATDKANEYRYHGIKYMSSREIERVNQWELEQARINAERIERAEQCDSFTIDDMYQFTGIPFGWSWVTQLNHTKGVPWFMLNKNNQQIALYYISQLNDMIIDAHSYVDDIDEAVIDLDRIDFAYPQPMHKDSMTNTRVECYPYTRTGRISKYPAILIFAVTNTTTNDDGLPSQKYQLTGEIKIMQDGNIGSANVYFALTNGNVAFRFGVYGVSLVIKRIDFNDDTERYKLYKFGDELKLHSQIEPIYPQK